MRLLSWILLILVIIGALYITDAYLHTTYATWTMAFLKHVVECFIKFCIAVVGFVKS